MSLLWFTQIFPPDRWAAPILSCSQLGALVFRYKMRNILGKKKRGNSSNPSYRNMELLGVASMHALQFFVGFWKKGHHASRILSEHPRKIQRFVERNCFQENWIFPHYCFNQFINTNCQSFLWAYQKPLGPENKLHIHFSRLGCYYLLVNIKNPNSWLPVSLFNYAIQIFHHFTELKKIGLGFFWKFIYWENKKMPKMKISTSQIEKTCKKIIF